MAIFEDLKSDDNWWDPLHPMYECTFSKNEIKVAMPKRKSIGYGDLTQKQRESFWFKRLFKTIAI